MSLADLNGGAGVPGGKIRITDKAGQSAIIDLSTAQTVGNVLDAINSNTSIQVKAVANGDGIQLTDETGSSTGTLSVSNVGNDTTATALGLTTLDSNGNGTSIVYLSDNLSLDAINDGNGMTANASLPDIHYQLSNGDKGDINLASTASGSSPTTQPQTLGQVLDIINAADPGKLVASISSDGQHLVVSDESGGNGSFSFTAENGSTALASLGLTGTPSNGVITGGQLLAGTQDVLLSSLNGGQGMGPLGQIEITNRNASSPVTVNLSNDATLGQVINSINAAKAGVTAQINPSDDGIELVDTSGGSGKLVVADAPGSTTSTAEALGIAVNAATSSVDSGDLHLQVVSASTPLASLNGGAGVAQGSFTITDSKGNTTTINLSSSSIQTVGNVINLINRSTVNVQAQIDSTGNGIELVNTAGGSGTLTVQEGGSTTAGDLHLLSSATASDDNGIKTQTIDGSGTYTVKWDDTAALSNVLTQIQGLNMGVSAQIIGDGSDSPYQLSLTSNQGGKNGAMVVNTSQAGFDFSQTVATEAHFLQLGGGGNGTIVSSSSNTFTTALNGVSLTINQASTEPVIVSVTQSDSNLVSNVQSLVTNYNTFRTTYQSLTAYNTTTNTPSTLTDDPAALSLDTVLSNLLTSSTGSGSVQSLADLGITVNSNGSLSLDQSTLQQEYAADPADVQKFLQDSKTGFAQQLDNAITQLAGSATRS